LCTTSEFEGIRQAPRGFEVRVAGPELEVLDAA
jgi:hypothetical protein